MVAATRKELTEALSHDPGLLYPVIESAGDADDDIGEQSRHAGERVLVETMVAPASRLIGQSLPQIGFRYKTRCVVLGIQRRSRMIRARMTDIRLQAGDVLLLQGQPDDIKALRGNRDVVLLEWSAAALPTLHRAKRATSIFLAAIGLAAAGLIPIVVATLTGAAAMVATGALNVRQAVRAVDSKIVTTIGATLALGVTLQETGGAAFLAGALVEALADVSPATVLSLFFLLVALLSNIISTKTTAVLFTPIAVDTALQIGVAPEAFTVAVIFPPIVPSPRCWATRPIFW